MFELRGVTFGYVLWLAACAGGDGASQAARGDGPGAEPPRSTQRSRAGAPAAPEGQVFSPRDSDPGTLGSNTNWRPLEPTPFGEPLPLPPARDERDAPIGLHAADDTVDVEEGDTDSLGGDEASEGASPDERTSPAGGAWSAGGIGAGG